MVIKMQLTALIYSVEDESFFTITLDGKKTYFYLQKHLAKKFNKYLRKGTYVTIDFSDKQVLCKKILAYKVNHFIEVSYPRKKYNKEVYYNLETIREGIKEIVSNINPIMFIDFEMNMQDYKPILNFEQEIIEAGMVLTNKDGSIMDFKHWYIKPTKFPKITNRAMKFLRYTPQTLKNAISFKSFYNELKAINEKYHPSVLVWGKSDITQLKKCFSINNCPDLNLHFIDLLQLHRNYDNLKESPGLFAMWEAYNNSSLPKQMHDSLEDAMVTKDVFFKFKEKILSRG